MKAMYINAPGQVEIKDVEMPVRKEGEVLLKLLYGGICGSDLGSYRGTFAYFDYPRIPGHEFSAEVIEADENNAYGIRKGMIVTCNPYFNCGHCYSCQHGTVNACMDNQTMGCQRDGAFQEYITMPIERVYDGKGMDAKTLAAIEPFCISYHGVSRANVKEGDKVLVVGAGTIGVLAAIAAKAKGASVYISDVSAGKLEMAKDFGVDGTLLNDSPKNFEKRVNEITDGNGFDVTIEAVGLPSTFQNCIDACCFGGRMVLIGVGKKNLDFNFTLIQKKELNVYGSRNALKKDFLELIDITENEAEETYLSSLETEADFFASAFLIDDLTDELKAEVVDMYKQVYAKAKYTVDTATEVDDSTFGVKVTVEPLDVFDRVAEALWGDTPDARAEALYSQDVDSMTDEEYAAYDAEWCRLVIDLTLEKLPEAEYLEAQSKVVQITLGDDNYWSLDEQDFSDLDWLILDYNF
mgnify:CR=1 FL=1